MSDDAATAKTVTTIIWGGKSIAVTWRYIAAGTALLVLVVGLVHLVAAPGQAERDANDAFIKQMQDDPNLVGSKAYWEKRTHEWACAHKDDHTLDARQWGIAWYEMHWVGCP
jgi:hypothetical protein